MLFWLLVAAFSVIQPANAIYIQNTPTKKVNPHPVFLAEDKIRPYIHPKASTPRAKEILSDNPNVRTFFKDIEAAIEGDEPFHQNYTKVQGVLRIISCFFAKYAGEITTTHATEILAFFGQKQIPVTFFLGENNPVSVAIKAGKKGEKLGCTQ